jgi:hypothetical protein
MKPPDSSGMRSAKGLIEPDLAYRIFPYSATESS